MTIKNNGLSGNPLIKQSDYYNNLNSFVEKGIAYDTEERAFLATIADDIAATFDAADSTLLRLVRIQQQDSTAARLGMESSLTAFLNSMYETSEYMVEIASSVRSSLNEAQSLMSASDATAFEYQIQKWLGSMYSVGMDQSTVTSIASAVGKLAAGDISALTDGSYGNLLVMAANQAGLSIADILSDGLNASESDSLMLAMVNYMSDLYGSTDSRVVQQQLAGVYGVNASDLKAATNLASKTSKVYGRSLSYNDALARLYTMAGTMSSRMSTGEMMSNI